MWSMNALDSRTITSKQNCQFYNKFYLHNHLKHPSETMNYEEGTERVMVEKIIYKILHRISLNYPDFLRRLFFNSMKMISFLRTSGEILQLRIHL